MITRRLLRPAGQLTSSSWICPSCSRTSLLSQIPQKRSLHSVPLLAYEDTFKTTGVPGLLSPPGFSIAWTQYQSMLVQKLNELTAGEPIENTPVKDLTIMFARDPMNASIFNHASAASNNHFFFSTLAASPLKITDCVQLQESLNRTFGSIETLRSTMLDTAAGMFGPGYVWLVWARNASTTSGQTLTSRTGAWRILTTYLAGTPYPEAGYRQQGVDMSTSSEASYKSYLAHQAQIPNNTAGAFGAYSYTGKEQAKIPPGGTSVMPVLCVSTWEHSYIYDFGVQGKRKFLSEWWRAVDWGVVEQNMPQEARSLSAFQVNERR